MRITLRLSRVEWMVRGTLGTGRLSAEHLFHLDAIRPRPWPVPGTWWSFTAMILAILTVRRRACTIQGTVSTPRKAVVALQRSGT